MTILINKIKAALGDCKRANSTCLEKTSYEVINKGFFFIFDNRDEPEEPVKIVYEPEYQLKVKNKDKSPICIIKTDNCLFDDDNKKCDCILFNEKKLFFIEISESGCGARGRKRNEAFEQLSTTIEIFKQKNIDLTELQLLALICFKYNKTKPTRTSSNTKRLGFFLKHGIDVEEGNFIEF